MIHHKQLSTQYYFKKQHEVQNTNLLNLTSIHKPQGLQKQLKTTSFANFLSNPSRILQKSMNIQQNE